MTTAAGPDATDNGLVLLYDAANGRCYSGSGTTAFDLSGNEYTATLYNSTGFSSLNGGIFTFNGSNQYMTNGYKPSGARSYFIWVKYNKLTGLSESLNLTGTQEINAYNYIGIYEGGTFYYYAGNSGGTASYTFKSGTWYHQGFVLNSDGSRTLYVNGQAVETQAGSLGGTATNTFYVGCINTRYWVDGSIGMVQQYNRALTATEVLQNYNATKVRFLSPPIIPEGLVLNLDAGNSASYSGSGTTWTDISTFGNNATLVNGPTYSTNFAGYLTFDGTNDYASFYAPNLTTTATIEMWAKIGDTNNRMLFGFHYYDVWFYGPMGFNTANSDIYGISAATITSLGLVGNWKHYIFVMRSDVAYTNNKIYINGVEQSLSQQSAAENSTYRNFNGGVGKIATWGGLDRQMPMDCAVFRVYNRSLSQAEISQNFNALRQRYGV